MEVLNTENLKEILKKIKVQVIPFCMKKDNPTNRKQVNLILSYFKTAEVQKTQKTQSQ